MNTNIKHIAAFAATAIWADGEYNEAEKIVLEEIAEAFELNEEEAELIYMAAMQIVLVDGVLSADEVNNLLSIAWTLGIDDDRAVLLLADMVKEEADLQIEL